MGIKTKGPANKKPGSKKGKAPHPMEKKTGFDTTNQYAKFAKTNVGGAAHGAVRQKSGTK